MVISKLSPGKVEETCKFIFLFIFFFLFFFFFLISGKFVIDYHILFVQKTEMHVP